jgi:hypothetical protein
VRCHRKSQLKNSLKRWAVITKISQNSRHMLHRSTLFFKMYLKIMQALQSHASERRMDIGLQGIDSTLGYAQL